MKKRIIIITISALLVGAAAFAMIQSGVLALFDEKKAVRLDAAEIENSTLAIGTHLIYLGALNQELFDIAKESADASSQNNMYYKSELAPSAGTWFDITNAETIADISTDGNPVSNDVIDALLFTHHTKSDGITYNLLTNKAEGIFDINSPYDLTTLPELEPLRLKAQSVQAAEGGTDRGKQKIALIEMVLKANVVTEYTKTLDMAISGLQKYYDVLKSNNAQQSWMTEVLAVMESVDATRRVAVFDILDKKLTELILTASSGSPGEEIGQGDSENAFSDLSESASSSQENVLNSSSEYSAKMFSDGDSVMTHQIFESSMSLYASAQKDAHAQCDIYTMELVALKNIAESAVVDKDKELNMLDAKLLVAATNQFTKGISAGVNQQYSDSIAKNESVVVQQSIRDDHYSELKVYENELEMFIDARLLRISSDEAKDYLGQQIETATRYYAQIRPDYFSEICAQITESYITWLKSKLSEIIGKEMKDDISKIDGMISDAQIEYLSSLDKNDLVKAAEAEAKRDKLKAERDAVTDGLSKELAKVDEAIRDIQKQLNPAGAGDGTGTDLDAELKAKIDAAIKELNTKKDALSKLETGLDTSGNVKKDASLSKDNILVSLKNGDDIAKISDMTDAYIGLFDKNFIDAFPYAKDISDALKNAYIASGDDTLKTSADKLDKAINEYKGKYDDALTLKQSISDMKKEIKELQDGTGTGTGTGTDPELKAQINAAVKELNDMKNELSKLEAGLDVSGKVAENASLVKDNLLALLENGDNIPKITGMTDVLLELLDKNFIDAFPYAESISSALINAYDSAEDETLKAPMDKMDKAMIEYSSKYNDVITLKQAMSDKENEIKNLRDGISGGTIVSPDKEGLLIRLAELQKKKAELEAGLSGTNNAATVSAGLKNDITELLQDKNSGEDAFEKVADLTKQMTGLVDSDYAAVFPNLNDVYQEVEKKQALLGKPSDTLDGAIDDMEKCILENKSAFDAAMDAGAVDVAFDPDSAEEKKNAFISDLLKKEKFSRQEQDTVYLGALKRYYEHTGEPAALDAMNKLAVKLVQQNNPLVYYKLTGSAGVADVYAPVKGTAYLTRMRLVKEEKISATLAAGAVFYRFTQGKKQVVKRAEGDTEDVITEMRLPAKSQIGIYIPGTYLLKEFAITAELLPESPYGIMYTERIGTQIEECYNALLK